MGDGLERGEVAGVKDTQTLFDYAGSLAQAGQSRHAMAILDCLLDLDAGDSDARHMRTRLASAPAALPDILSPASPREFIILTYAADPH